MFTEGKKSPNRAEQMQPPLHIQIPPLLPKNLLLFHFYHHHVFNILEVSRWETKVEDSDVL